MKNLLEFFKLTALGGLMVLLPILLLILLLNEVFALLVGLATPIADLFPKGTFEDPQHPVLLALILLTAVSFLIGLAVKSEGAKRLGNWVESKTIGRMPMYHFVKQLVSGLLTAEETAGFKPALMADVNGAKRFVYIVERHADGNLTILVPRAPAAFAGVVQIISENQVEPIDASLGDISLVQNHLGLGAEHLLNKGKE